ncbi:hypothetical protein SLE2022_241450 [Rubroshorea leprosula]
MERFVDAGLAHEAYGQTTIGFGNTKQSLDDCWESFLYGQLNENSSAIMAQPEAPVPQATLVANTSITNQDRAIKRARDKAYREREKKRKIEMEDNLKELTQENNALKDEVRASKAENTRLNQAFQSQGEGMDKLKHDFNQLKHDYIKQNVVVQTLSGALAVSVPSPRDEIQKLKNEIDLLRQGMGMDSPCLELMKENAKLKHALEKEKHEKRALKVQLDALCAKIIAENPSP